MCRRHRSRSSTWLIPIRFFAVAGTLTQGLPAQAQYPESIHLATAAPNAHMRTVKRPHAATRRTDRPPGRSPRFRLPETAVVVVPATAPDGAAIARPASGEGGDGPPPVVFMAAEPQGRPALAPGERVLARLSPIGPG